MRRLLLLRHAKAERLQPGGEDHDRALADRGRNDARTLGTYLARHRFVPDRALVSTAVRTRETWTQVATAFSKKPSVHFEERLYDASPQMIVHVIQETAPTAEAWAREQRAEPARAAAPSSGEAPMDANARDVLVVVSKLKGYVKATAGMNTSDDVVDVIREEADH